MGPFCCLEIYFVMQCIKSKGTDYEPCTQFYKAYRSLCPDEWVCMESFHYNCLYCCCVMLLRLHCRRPSGKNVWMQGSSPPTYKCI